MCLCVFFVQCKAMESGMQMWVRSWVDCLVLKVELYSKCTSKIDATDAQCTTRYALLPRTEQNSPANS
jgi:hypothetical protein